MVNINRLFKECKDELTNLNVPYCNDSYITTCRRESAWGDCHKEDNGSYRIRVSERLLTTDEHSIKTTIIHELLHTVPGGHGHRGNWKRYAEYVSSNTNYNITRTTSSAEKGLAPRQINRLAYKYKAVCDSCGHEYFYKKNCSILEIMRGNVKGYCTCPKCKNRKFTLYNLY